MDVAEIRAEEQRLDAVGRDTGRVQELAIGRARRAGASGFGRFANTPQAGMMWAAPERPG
jgi:hypothetical protein